MGSLAAGNEDGSVPAWAGGIQQWPAGFEPGDWHVDPYSEDLVQGRVTAANANQYEELLAPGQLALLRRYPDSYQLNLYPSRRSLSLPPAVIKATTANRDRARLTKGGNSIEGALGGIPFPGSSKGMELIWNHRLRYRGASQEFDLRMAAPSKRGAYRLLGARVQRLEEFYRPDASADDLEKRLSALYQEVVSPAADAGNLVLVHEPVNRSDRDRQIWVWNKRRGRVLRAPAPGEGNPASGSDGLATSDMLDMFSGIIGDWQWESRGRRELLVPYNSYRAHGDAVALDALVTPGHLAPGFLRYERHRVWVLEATLKAGATHPLPRRTFYLDEDSYQILLAEHYDEQGQLRHVSEAHCINYYEVPLFASTLEAHYDLSSGRYVVYGLDNSDRVPQFNTDLPRHRFTPQYLRSQGR